MNQLLQRQRIEHRLKWSSIFVVSSLFHLNGVLSFQGPPASSSLVDWRGVRQLARLHEEEWFDFSHQPTNSFSKRRRRRKRQQERHKRFPLRTPCTASNPSLFYVASTNDELSHVEMPWEQVVLPPDLEDNCKVDSVEGDEPCKISGLQPPHSAHEIMMDKIILSATALSTIALLLGLIVVSGEWRYYLAGGVCAAISHLIPVPVDVIKTRKQVDPSLSDVNFVRAMREIIRNEGLRSLFVGTGPTFLGYFLEGSIKFGVYEFLKPGVKNIVHIQSVAFVVSAAISGLAASIVLCPMEALRIRLVAEPEYASRGWIRGALTMIEREGASGFGKGMLSMICKQVPYTITKNVSFDLFAKLAYGILLLRSTTATTSGITKFVIPLGSAALASLLSCVSSQPGDMLLSLVNAHGGSRLMGDIASDILRSDRGIRGFFVGIKTRFIHVGIIVTLQLLLYDCVKRLCGIAATGSV